MHLSFAYGDGLDPGWHAEAARDVLERVLERGESGDDWEVGLWRRHDDDLWERL